MINTLRIRYVPRVMISCLTFDRHIRYQRDSERSHKAFANEDVLWGGWASGEVSKLGRT